MTLAHEIVQWASAYSADFCARVSGGALVILVTLVAVKRGMYPRR